MEQNICIQKGGKRLANKEDLRRRIDKRDQKLHFKKEQRKINNSRQ